MFFLRVWSNQDSENAVTATEPESVGVRTDVQGAAFGMQPENGAGYGLL